MPKTGKAAANTWLAWPQTGTQPTQKAGRGFQAAKSPKDPESSLYYFESRKEHQIPRGIDPRKVFFEEEKVVSPVNAVVTLGQVHGNCDNKEPKAGNDEEDKSPPSTSSEVEKRRIRSPEEQNATKPSSKKPRIIRRKTEGSRQQDHQKIQSSPSIFFESRTEDQMPRGAEFLQNLFYKRKKVIPLVSVAGKVAVNGDAKEPKAGYERESHKKNIGSVAADSEICSCC